MGANITTAALLEMAAQGSDTTTFLAPAGLFVGIMSGPVTVNPPVTADDLTLPLAADHPAQAVGTWQAPQLIGNGVVAIQGPVLHYRPANAAAAVVVYGVYYADAAVSGNIYKWEEFATPISLPDENHAFDYVPSWAWQLDARWDVSEIVGDLA